VRIVLTIGAFGYPLTEGEARWLESAIRLTCVDAAGQAWDREAGAALGLADALHEDLTRQFSPEPVELGRVGALGLLNVFHDKDVADVQAHVARSDTLAALYLALRRFVRDAA
jgi:hypothetical protein